MKATETVSTFLDFFAGRGHALTGGSSLLTEPGDPVLFVSAGMHPLTRYLEGRPHPLGRRLAGVQRCLRTTDLAEVGDPIHLTLFEMLGSWSLGDYPGPQSLRWGYELLRDGFGISPDRMHATVFGGDGQVGPDTEALAVWQDLGVPTEVTVEDNWWSNGPTGPCGPDSEIFVWTGDTPPVGTPGGGWPWMELWNHVTMRYFRKEDGTLEPLPRVSVDTGMGLERLLMVLQGKSSVQECDVFDPWAVGLSGRWGLDGPPLRLVIDHLRASTVIIGEGVRPAAGGRGYVLRRLIRRALTTLWGADGEASLADLPPGPVADTLARFGLGTGAGAVCQVLTGEERRFAGLLTRGAAVVGRLAARGPLTDDDYRYLHDTHGLPRDLVTELLAGPG
jgi:alanyl-tRNA synthetase